MVVHFLHNLKSFDNENNNSESNMVSLLSTTMHLVISYKYVYVLELENIKWSNVVPSFVTFGNVKMKCNTTNIIKSGLNNNPCTTMKSPHATIMTIKVSQIFKGFRTVLQNFASKGHVAFHSTKGHVSSHSTDSLVDEAMQLLFHSCSQ